MSVNNTDCLQFADDDWLAANDLLPSLPSADTSVALTQPPEGPKDPLAGAKVSCLRLKPITTVTAKFPCEAAIEIMRDKGFDQLPVLAPSGRKLVGLVTLGNVLSRLTHGRATGQSPVSEVMFDFSRIPEVVTDPRDLGVASAQPKGQANGTDTLRPQIKGRQFIEITMDTPLSVLNRFFEWNSAAIVTERDETGAMKPVAVATKVDLLTWMLHRGKTSA